MAICRSCEEASLPRSENASSAIRQAASASANANAAGHGAWCDAQVLLYRMSSLLSTVLWNGSLVRCLSHRPRSDMELGEKAVMNLTGLANPSLGNPSSGPFPRP